MEKRPGDWGTRPCHWTTEEEGLVLDKEGGEEPGRFGIGYRGGLTSSGARARLAGLELEQWKLQSTMRYAARPWDDGRGRVAWRRLSRVSGKRGVTTTANWRRRRLRVAQLVDLHPSTFGCPFGSHASPPLRGWIMVVGVVVVVVLASVVASGDCRSERRSKRAGG